MHITSQALVCASFLRLCSALSLLSSVPSLCYALAAPLASGCSVLIERKNASQAGTIINLSELRLFNRTGTQIPSRQLLATMSSIHNMHDAGLCLDGVDSVPTGGPNMCSTAVTPPDPNPWLRVYYPCSEGLSRVQIVNRHDGFQDRITAFRMHFLDGSNWVIANAYEFDVAQPTYTAETGMARGVRGSRRGGWVHNCDSLCVGQITSDTPLCCADMQPPKIVQPTGMLLHCIGTPQVASCSCLTTKSRGWYHSSDF